MFDRFWRDWDRIFKEINYDFERMFKHSMKELPKDPENVRTWGFKMFWDNSMEKPVFRYFGNVDPVTGKLIEDGYRIPSIEKTFNPKNNTWRVIVELPGVKKGEINLATTNTHLNLETSSKDHKYKHQVEFDAEIEPESIKAKFNNGILDITIKAKISPKPEAKKIIIE
ncbi:MAG: Hsp20/alpha crystallin family protein [Candidatus Hermodarchaeota archaeon]